MFSSGTKRRLGRGGTGAFNPDRPAGFLCAGPPRVYPKTFGLRVPNFRLRLQGRRGEESKSLCRGLSSGLACERWQNRKPEVSVLGFTCRSRDSNGAGKGRTEIAGARAKERPFPAGTFAKEQPLEVPEDLLPEVKTKTTL